MGMNFTRPSVKNSQPEIKKIINHIRNYSGPVYTFDVETTAKRQFRKLYGGAAGGGKTDLMKKFVWGQVTALPKKTFNFKGKEFVKMADRYPTWKTKHDGEMYIKDMSDNHLMNTITMIESNYAKIYSSEPNLENVSLFCPEYSALREELSKRQKEGAWKQDIVQRLAEVETLYNSASEVNDRNNGRYISLYSTVSKMSLKLTSLMAVNESLRKEISEQITAANFANMVRDILVMEGLIKTGTKKVRKNVRSKSRRNM